jgi:hypothetical protein
LRPIRLAGWALICYRAAAYQILGLLLFILSSDDLPRMHTSGMKWLLVVGCLLELAALSGCSKGPLWRTGYISPWARKKWAEDERYGPTLFTRLPAIKSLADRAAWMDPAEQQRVSQEFAEQLRTESNPLVRIHLVKALGAFPTPTAAEALRTALTDSDTEVRMAACSAWQRRGGPEGLEALAQVVGSDTSLDVRLAATRALSTFRDPAAVRALGMALDDSDPALQYRAVQSLKSVSGRDYGTDLTAWRQFVRGDNPLPPQQPSLVERLRNWN